MGEVHSGRTVQPQHHRCGSAADAGAAARHVPPVPQGFWRALALSAGCLEVGACLRFVLAASTAVQPPIVQTAPLRDLCACRLEPIPLHSYKGCREH